MTEDNEKIQRRKQQQAENEALWVHMTRDVRPIDRSDVLPQTPEAGPPAITPERHPEKMRARDVLPLKTPETQPVGREIDARTAQRLRKGQITIEARLDLHGMGRVQAYDALQGFIARAVMREMRCVLVITGKGYARISTPADDDAERGVLRRSVPQWLDEARMHGHVLKVQQAQPKDGGSGAFYVFLRRRRGQAD